MRKWWLIILGLVVVLVIALFALPGLQRALGLRNANAGNAIQTVTVQRGDLTAYVGATGSVRSNQTAVLNWLASGQVASGAAGIGQKVKKGDVLASLEPSSLSPDLVSAQSDLVTAKNNLKTVLDNTKPRADAELALTQAQKALDDAEKSTQSKLYQNASADTIDIARANVIEAQSEVDKWTKIYNQVSTLGQDNENYAAALSGLANARQQLTRSQYNLQYAMSLPDPLSVQTTYAQLDQAKAALLSAKQDWDKVKNGPNPDDIAAAQAKVDAAQAAINTTRISAPFDGTVTVVNSKTGDRVAMGTAAFQVDDLSHLLVDVQVSEVDVNSVQPNQPVELTFDAVPDKTYAGVVTEIATVGVASSGTVNFTISVAISDPDAAIKPGMTASANIAVTQLKGVLLVPSRAVRVINNKRVVYVVRNGQTTPVEIVLGATDNTNYQVVSGNLHEGDQIMLNPPTTITTGGGGIIVGGGNRGGENSAAPTPNATSGGTGTGGNGGK